MKTLYLDCSMGAAGDMLTAALLELHPNPDAILARLGDLHLPGVTVAAEPAENGGVRGTHMAVTVHGEAEEDEHHHHHHATPATISHLLSHLNLPGAVRSRVQRVYDRIAKAESKAHGVPVSEIHFHEVGALDAMADIAAVCLLMDALRPDRVVVSPICVGAGSVRCAHGVLPVPAPATARLLTGAPIYGSDFPGELCTPTGAALLMEFATAFGAMPPMTLEKVGVGIGSKTFPKANCLRAFLGETPEAPDTVFELLCTVDAGRVHPGRGHEKIPAGHHDSGALPGESAPGDGTAPFPPHHHPGNPGGGVAAICPHPRDPQPEDAPGRGSEKSRPGLGRHPGEVGV